MPTTYAHDLFGKEVYKKLPSDMKALIRRHGDLYRIGLHGPDILFYYMVSKNPVTQFGIDMHHENLDSAELIRFAVLDAGGIHWQN